MVKNTMGHAQTDTTQNQSESKGNQCSKISARILAFMATGEKHTAREINIACNTDNARKYISDFGIKYGIVVNREWTDNGNKLFWLEPARKEVAL